LGAKAVAGTLPNGLLVVFPNAGTPSAADSSGNCQITNTQGYPKNFLWTHNTTVDAAALSELTGNTVNPNGFPYGLNGLLRDSIFTGNAGWNNNNGEGTTTEKQGWDVNSLSTNYMVWATRTASKYTEYGNKPGYSDAAGCGGAGCSPPTTMYFPATPYCSGATATSACIGFTGAMSAGSLPLAPNDYHDFVLVPTSLFKAGGSQQASDGKDMGASISAIDAAQSQNTFVCDTVCGTPGPYPDH
jgi:hypothetical protein